MRLVVVTPLISKSIFLLLEMVSSLQILFFFYTRIKQLSTALKNVPSWLKQVYFKGKMFRQVEGLRGCLRLLHSIFLSQTDSAPRTLLEKKMWSCENT
jgi:hypothetical protein